MGHPPAPPRPATYDDLVALPDHVVGEIIGGELFVSPRPAPRHAFASGRLHSKLAPLYDDDDGNGPGGWWMLFEPELHFGADVLVPDIAGWRRANMPAMPATAFFTATPDWVCEVLSPSTAQLDRGKKLDVYARQGVSHVWLVDPVAHTLETLRLHDHDWIATLHAGDDAVRLPPFADTPFALTRLWAD